MNQEKEEILKVLTDLWFYKSDKYRKELLEIIDKIKIKK